MSADPRSDPLGELRGLVARLSFREGAEFTLASGRVSSVYFNMKPTLMEARGAALVGRLVGERARALGASYVGGLAMGAVPIVAAAVAAAGIDGGALKGVFVRKEAKGHGTKSQIEGLVEGEGLDGMPLLLVEDVTTTGGSALRAASILRDAGARVSDVLTLVDRMEGAEAAFAAEALTLHALLRKSDFTQAL